MSQTPPVEETPTRSPARPPGRWRRFGRALRTGWLLLGATIALGLAIEIALQLGFAIKDALFAPPHPDPRLVADGYDGAPWVAELFREEERVRTDWYPYIGFREKPFQGTYIFIDKDGVRRTWKPPAPPEGVRPVRILCLGGSALWGMGARNDHTIPSLLARELARRGVTADVTNLGEIGHVNTQELLALLLELRRGRRPDVVIFHDGVNDLLAAYQNGVAGLPQNVSNRRAEFAAGRSPRRQLAAGILALVQRSASFRLATSVSKRIGPGGSITSKYENPEAAPPAELVREVIRTHDANRRIIESLGREYGFTPRFYWQPTLFTRKHPTAFERDELTKYRAFEPYFLQLSRQATAHAAADQSDDLGDLSHVLDDQDRLMFTDFCHTTENANAHISRALADDLMPLVKGLADTHSATGR